MDELKIPAWLRNPLLWPAPALAVTALVLVFSERAWIDKLPSRRGPPMSVAEGSIKLTLAGLALYAVVLVLRRTGWLFIGSKLGASEAQEGCVTALLVLFILALPYLAALNLVLRYVLG